MNALKTDTGLGTDKLSIGYSQKGQPKEILGQLSLSLKPGRFVCLLGPNGSGKSTLLRTLSGLQAPLSGKIHLCGQALADINARERAKQLSIVFTESLHMGHLSAYDCVALGRHPFSGIFGRLNTEDHSKINWALKAVDAEHLANRQITELSDGERQKIAIARALAQEARLMLLDEPTAFLDLPHKVESMQLLRQLCHTQGIGMLLTTHDLDLAIRFADELWLISKTGDLLQGPPEVLALNGHLAAAFKNENLDWDTAHGHFRPQRKTCMTIQLQGSGPELIWTSRALHRLGYEANTDASNFDFKVCIQNDGSRAEWALHHEEKVENFECLNSLIQHLESLSH